MRIVNSRLCSMFLAAGCVVAAMPANAQGLDEGLNWTTSQATINSFYAQAFGIAPGSGVIGVSLVSAGQPGLWNVVLISSGQHPGTGLTVGQYIETNRIAISESTADVDLGNGGNLHRTEAYVTGLMSTTAGFTAVVNCTIFSVTLTGTPENATLPGMNTFVPVQAYDAFDPAEIDLETAARTRNGDGPVSMPSPPDDEKAAICMEKWNTAVRIAKLTNSADRKDCLKDSGFQLAACGVGCWALVAGWPACMAGCATVVLINEAICMSGALDKFNAAIAQAQQDYRDCMRLAHD